MPRDYIYALENLIRDFTRIKLFFNDLVEKTSKTELKDLLNKVSKFLEYDLSNITFSGPHERWSKLNDIKTSLDTEKNNLISTSPKDHLQEIALASFILGRYSQDLEFYLKDSTLDTFFDLIIEGNINGVLEFLKINEKLLYEKNANGWGILHICASRGHGILINEIINKYKHIDINLKDEEGNTPILIAAAYGHVETVIALKKHGADTSITNDEDEGIRNLLRNKNSLMTLEQEEIIFNEKINENQTINF